jgi:uncharacterized protein
VKGVHAQYTPFNFGGNGVEQELRTLYEAQKLDSQISEFQRKILLTPKTIAALDNEVRELTDKVAQEKELAEELDKQRRAAEKELEVEREKVKKFESKLYEVKTNKEYQALLKEIETIKTANDKLEEDVLRLMDQVENVKKELRTSTAKLKTRQGEIEGEKTTLQAEFESIDRRILQLKTERDGLLSVLDKGLRKSYELLRDKRGGLAVVNVKEGVCLGCFMNIPPQMFIEVTKNRQVLSCPSCNRIFFFNEED